MGTPAAMSCVTTLFATGEEPLMRDDHTGNTTESENKPGRAQTIRSWRLRRIISGAVTTPAQFATIQHCLPRQRGNVSQRNLQVVSAILYVAEHGCKRRGLSKRFGK